MADAKQALSLEQKRALLARRLADGREFEVHPLSFFQERIWLLDRLDPGNTSYNMPTLFRVPAACTTAVIERALNELVRRHEILRTTLHLRDGVPEQRVAHKLALKLDVVDLRALPEGRRQEEWLKLPRRFSWLPPVLHRVRISCSPTWASTPPASGCSTYSG